MDLLDKIKELAKRRSITISMLEDEINIPRNTIYQWKKRVPSLERLQLVADYFNVSTDYLLGREVETTDKVVELTEKDVRFSFDGEEVSDEVMRAAIALIETMSRK